MFFIFRRVSVGLRGDVGMQSSSNWLWMRTRTLARTLWVRACLRAARARAGARTHARAQTRKPACTHARTHTHRRARVGRVGGGVGRVGRVGSLGLSGGRLAERVSKLCSQPAQLVMARL